MRTIRVVLLLYLSAALPVSAELFGPWWRGKVNMDLPAWVLVGDFQAELVFATKVRSSRNGSLVTVWERTEFKTLGSLRGAGIKEKYSSAMTGKQYDCNAKTSSTLSVAYFSDHNLAGTVIFNRSWDPRTVPVFDLVGYKEETTKDWACKNIDVTTVEDSPVSEKVVPPRADGDAGAQPQ